MIKDPELVLGFQELVTDSDAVVVKRTVKVFTSVYHHTLRLLSLGELDEELLMKSWSSVNGVVDRLLAMVRGCDNEGVLMYILRFLEAAITAHLSYDLTRFPVVFERGREVIKTGLKALKDLVTTPYVGGSSFNVGVRALISIACLRPDLWEPVTDLLKKQVASLPPTLFDHNVRSLNKTLQKNLFRLLRRADKFELKEKLIDMMVSVGVSRKMIAPWAPQALETRKRSPPQQLSDSIYIRGSFSPPAEKKLRIDSPNISHRKSRSRSNTPEIPTNPVVQVPQEQDYKEPNVPENKVRDQSDKTDLNFLKSLIPVPKPEEKRESPTKIESELYSLLDLERVSNLVMNNLDKLPDIEPIDFVSRFKGCGESSSDIEVMRRRHSSLLNKYFMENDIDLDNVPEVVKRDSTPSLDQLESNTTEVKMVTSSSSSATSTPSSTPPLSDTDLRQVYPRPPMGDVDMRISDPRLINRDPRLLNKDPRIRKDIDSRIKPFTNQQEQFLDPRLSRINAEQGARSDPRVNNKSELSPMEEPKARVDPRLESKSKKTTENPRRTRWGPRPSDETREAENNLPSSSEYNQVNSDPRINKDSGQRPTDPRTVTSRNSDPRSNADMSQRQLDPRVNNDISARPSDPRIKDMLNRLGDPRSVNGLLQKPTDPRAQGDFPQRPSDPRNNDFTQRLGDPRVNRPNQGQGLLPHPDTLPTQQNFLGPQPPFPFNAQNNMNHFNGPFIGNIRIPHMFSNNPFGWDNNLMNAAPPTILLAQTLASVQQGLLPLQ